MRAMWLPLTGFVVLLVTFSIGLGKALAPSDEPSLAEKINAACKQGYTPAGWQAATDLNGVPVTGVIRVQCEARESDEYGRFDTYYVAVDR